MRRRLLEPGDAVLGDTQVDQRQRTQLLAQAGLRRLRSLGRGPEPPRLLDHRGNVPPPPAPPRSARERSTAAGPAAPRRPRAPTAPARGGSPEPRRIAVPPVLSTAPP